MTATLPSGLPSPRAMLRRLVEPVASTLRDGADLLVPPVCVACRAPLSAHGVLCGQCWSSVDFIRPPLCDRLGIPLPYDAGPGAVSARALAAPPSYGRARAVARHAGVMRDLVHRLKYGDQHHGLALFGRLLAMAGHDVLDGADLLVPVPLARFRLWRRGFNQAALIAASLSRVCGVPSDPLLVQRTRATPSQVGLNHQARHLNVKGAFALSPARAGSIRGRHLVVIDDVITTGATVDALTRVLKRGGAARVDVLSLTLVTDDIVLPG
jgi:ComF family protein